MLKRRMLLILALVALTSSAALAKPKSGSTADDSTQKRTTGTSSQGPEYHCYDECSCCTSYGSYDSSTCPDGTDMSAYNCCVEVVPRCPVPPPPGAPEEVQKQVNTTITVIFPCADELWNDMTAEQQRPFRNGTYVPAWDIDVDLLDAFNLLKVPMNSAYSRKSVVNNVAVNVTVGLSKDEGGANPPSPAYGGLEAILYLEEFRQWQILATDAQSLQEIIIRVTNIMPEEPKPIPGASVRQGGAQKPTARRPQSVMRNSYHKTTGRNMLTTEMIENSMRQLLQATTNDPLFPEQYHLPLTNTPQAWEITRGSKDITVAVVDTGCDVTHPDLTRNIWVNPGEDAGDGVDNDGDGIVDDINGANFINTQVANDLTDVNGHGTHVAGIVGARGNNGIGVSGVMQRAALMCLKAIVGTNEPAPNPALGPLDATVRAWHYALRKGARIINNSWSAVGPINGLFDRTSDQYTALVRKYSEPLLALQRARVLNVWAAGNEGADIDPPNPTSGPNTVLSTVRNQDNDEPGKVNLQLIVVNTDANDAINPSSNRGDIETDLAAPGTLILSTAPTAPSELFGPTCGATPEDTCVIDGIYGYLTGTSQASPVVAGTAGLCLAVLEPCHREDDTQIAYDCILATVDPIPGLAGNVRTGGRVNTGAAVACCQQYCNRKPGGTVTGKPTGPGKKPRTTSDNGVSVDNRNRLAEAINALADRVNKFSGKD